MLFLPLVWSKTRQKILPLKPSRQQGCPLNMTMRKSNMTMRKVDNDDEEMWKAHLDPALHVVASSLGSRHGWAELPRCNHCCSSFLRIDCQVNLLLASFLAYFGTATTFFNMIVICSLGQWGWTHFGSRRHCWWDWSQTSRWLLRGTHQGTDQMKWVWGSGQPISFEWNKATEFATRGELDELR